MSAHAIFPRSVLHKVYEDLHVVGGDVMVLKQEYPSQQLWLPFGTTILFRAYRPEPVQPYTRYNFKARPYVVVTDQERMMYPRDNSLYAKQYVLPFKEHKRVNNGAMKALKKHHFPLWDKNPRANSPQVIENLFHLDLEDRRHTRPDIEAWCDEHLRGRYFLRAERTIYFELEFDALMAKMYFS